jgi:hypothetical protein
MDRNDIYIGQLLVLKKLEEIPDEVNEVMKPWCGRVVKVLDISMEGPPDDEIAVIRLEECPDEEWYVEDFEREAPYQNEKPPGYPFYTPSEKSVYTPTGIYASNKGVVNPENLVPPSWCGRPSKINPNKAFKAKKFGDPKKQWKFEIKSSSTGRINPCGEIGIHEEKRVIEFNKEKKEYEYVTFNMTSEQLNSAPQATYTIEKGLDGKITIKQE